MRDIKFRTWDIINKKLYGNVDRIDWLLSGEVKRAHCCLSEIENIVLHNGYNREQNFILMQFTGLHDKSGKEIYEGDIVLWNNKTMPVEWYCGGFCVKHLDEDYLEELGEYFPNEKCIEDIAVIGNIYENPDLVP